MAVFKCKMCGGTIGRLDNGIGVCEFCGTKQTISHTDEEKKLNLLDRANHFRMQSDFDKATVIYEQVLEEDTTDSDIYYSLALCKYGITYVDDLKTNKKIPTINRMQIRQFTKDPDYIMAIEKANAEQKSIYKEEGEYINNVQNEILDITKNEKPYDVFICYKETDEYGERTKDSVLANELYYELTNEGYKVFFSKITLEGKLGTAYEPYIFAALQSSKVMVVICTKKDYVNSPWVKNEWSRFLSFIKEGQKKILIPAYRDMDPYDLPDEFVNLQAQDMSKLGFMQDLLRGIKKIIEGGELTNNNDGRRISENERVQSLLKRVKIFIDDDEWEKADEYCEKALDIDAENPDIYLYKFLIDIKEKSIESVKSCEKDFREISNNFNKLIKYSKGEKREYYNDINCKFRYENACASMNNKSYDRAIEIFKSIIDYKDSKEKIEKCKYDNACMCMNNKQYEMAEIIFQSIIDYEDSKGKIDECSERIEEYKEKIKECKYEDGCNSMNNKAYEEAVRIFQTIIDYKDSKEKICECRYGLACSLIDLQHYNAAKCEFEKIENYKDSREKIKQCLYEMACDNMALHWYDRAIKEFQEIVNYKDSKDKIKEIETIKLKEERREELIKSIKNGCRLIVIIILLLLLFKIIFK